MKKIVLISIFSLLSLFGYTQNTIYDKTKAIYTNAPSGSTILTRITVEKDNLDAYTIKLKSNNKIEEYTIKPLEFGTFHNGFTTAFLNLNSCKIDESKTELKMLFMDVLLHKSEEKEAPLAGVIHLEDSIGLGYLVEETRKLKGLNYKQLTIKAPNDPTVKNLIIKSKSYFEELIKKENANQGNNEKKAHGSIVNNTVLDSLYFIPNKTQIEFSEGYIRNITITGSVYKHEDKCNPIFKEAIFKNEIPIGFSSHKDYSNLKEISLSLETKHKHINLKIPISYFLCYHPNLRINTRDYCPENGVINIEHPSNEIKLRKEKAANILTARVFSDILGMQEDSPNGIIQTEVEKRINLVTRRHKFLGRSNFGFFQYAKPYVVLSKVEKQNRYLELEEQQKEKTLKVNSLDLIQHEAFRVGTDINLITFDGVSGKSTICWDSGVAFSKVIVSDTTTIETAESNKIHINNINLYTKAKISLFPDERYGINFSYQLNYYSPLNHEIKPLPIKTDGDNKNWLQSMEMMAFLKTGDSGKMFFRYRLNSSLTNWNYNFAQVQLGYSFDITKQIK